MQVDAVGAVVLVPGDPVTGQRRRAAEILAEYAKRLAALALVDPLEEIQIDG